VVNVKLTDVYWLKVTVLAVVLLVDCIGIDKFIVGFDVDALALVSCAKTGSLRVSKFDSSRATD
jgi:hypothetical protein